MKKIIIFAILAISFCHIAFAQILRPYPPPEITGLFIKSSEIPGIYFLEKDPNNDSTNEFYFSWVDSIYDAYPNFSTKLSDGSEVWVIKLESLEQIQNIEKFIKSRMNQNPPRTLNEIVPKIYKLYIFGHQFKMEWTKYLHALWP